MPSKRKRKTEAVRRDVVRLIITTRERFPHTPTLTTALRRVMWRYVTAPLPIKRPTRGKRKLKIKPGA
jgi:hypothetical protein